MLSIDPGEKHVGWAGWWSYDDYRFAGCGQVAADEFMEFLEFQLRYDLIPRTVVIESYGIRPEHAKHQLHKRQSTVELIALIKRECGDMGVEVVEQSPSIKDTTEKTPYYKNHVKEHGRPRGKHAKDAVLHGIHRMHLSSSGPQRRIGARPAAENG